ncbi:hypothetical protein D9M71_707080 [compost metagenome]
MLISLMAAGTWVMERDGISRMPEICMRSPCTAAPCSGTSTSTTRRPLCWIMSMNWSMSPRKFFARSWNEARRVLPSALVMRLQSCRVMVL